MFGQLGSRGGFGSLGSLGKKTSGGGDTTPPTITSSGTQTVLEGNAFSLTLTANETVTWTKTGGADTARFTLTGSTLSMTAKSFGSPTDADTNNTYIVQVTATDTSSNATNQTVTVTVTQFTPALLTPKFWYEPALGGMFQSNAGTTAASANTNPVGYMPDQSGNAFTQLSAADDTTRPLLGGVGTNPYLLFDGTNDILRALGDGASFAAAIAGGTSWFLALQSNTSGTGKTVLGQSRSTTSVPAIILTASNSTTASTAACFIRNDANTTLISTTTAVQTGVYDNTAKVYGTIEDGSGVTPYVNGVAGTRVTHTTLSGVVTSDRLSLGSGLNTAPTGFWSGRIYAVVGVNRVLTAPEIANLTTYLGTRAGLTV